MRTGHSGLETVHEAELLEDCIASGGGAWDRLFAEVRPLILLICRRVFHHDAEDAEDVYQLTCLKLFANLRCLRAQGAFRPWLRCLIRRAAVDYIRQRKQTISLDALKEDGDVGEWGAESSWEARIDVRLEVKRALDNLPERYREPVSLHIIDGAAQEEVSLLLGRPRGTVASQISRGLVRLRRSLSAFEYA